MFKRRPETSHTHTLNTCDLTKIASICLLPLGKLNTLKKRKKRKNRRRSAGAVATLTEFPEAHAAAAELTVGVAPVLACGDVDGVMMV